MAGVSRVDKWGFCPLAFKEIQAGECMTVLIITLLFLTLSAAILLKPTPENDEGAAMVGKVVIVMVLLVLSMSAGLVYSCNCETGPSEIWSGEAC